MDLTQLANLGEFIGGVAVLVTWIYLALQIRQNTQAVTFNTQKEMWTSFSDLASEVTQNSEVAKLLLACKHADRSLTPEDEERLEWFLTRLVGEYESAYSQWTDGLFETKPLAGCGFYDQSA